MVQDMQNLLQLRRQAKKRKPVFVRQDAHKKVRIKKTWKKPHGLQSKMRLHEKGYRRCVSPGFKSPAEVRCLTRQGLTQVQVSNLDQLKAIDPQTQAAMITKTVGMRNRIGIIKEALSKKITIMNYKNPEQFLKTVEEALMKKKEKKKSREEAKQKKESDKEKKKGIEKKVDEQAVSEEQKDGEKKEKDKVLTKKGSETYG